MTPAAPIALRIGALLCGVAGATALAVLVTGTASARDWLGFPFIALPRTLDETLSILANNLRILAAVFIACYAAQLALRAEGPGRLWIRAIGRICDATLIAVAAAHALIIGAGVGAFGGRMVAALVPHGPIELSAYSLALALYLSARKEPIDRRRWVVCGSACVLQLAVAAPLEVFVVL